MRYISFWDLLNLSLEGPPRASINASPYWSLRKPFKLLYWDRHQLKSDVSSLFESSPSILPVRYLNFCDPCLPWILSSLWKTTFFLSSLRRRHYSLEILASFCCQLYVFYWAPTSNQCRPYRSMEWRSVWLERYCFQLWIWSLFLLNWSLVWCSCRSASQFWGSSPQTTNSYYESQCIANGHPFV